MPNIDGGHYWLTALLPIQRTPIKDHDLLWTQPINLVRRALSYMVTAQQSPASIEMSCNTGYVSPFSLNVRNHFVRFAVIGTLAYNGRDPMDAVVQTIKRIDMNDPQRIDRLKSEYLLFAADFDAPSGNELELEIYLDTLWATIPAVQLNDLFSHCVGWDKVETSADFCRWIRQCQVTTSLPFNDYWIDPPAFPSLPWQRLAPMGAGLGAVAAIITGLLIGYGNHPWWLWLLWVLLFAVGGAIWALLRGINQLSDTPWPTAPGSDLPSILKGLYLQREFIDFAVTAQGASPEALYQQFAEFADQNRPGEALPTQLPGTINAADLPPVRRDLQRPYGTPISAGSAS